MRNKEIEEFLEKANFKLRDSVVREIHNYIEELEDKIAELEEENNDLQHQIDALNEREP